eukprot:INCI4633.1.p1 GENE.INCI4633.1~~INCI4633.1.p1  ORF type:complete len:563 (-),score=96.53 INCI4633.1:1649-3337(-)
MNKQRSSVLSRAGSSVASPKQAKKATSSRTTPGGGSGAFALTEVQIPESQHDHQQQNQEKLEHDVDRNKSSPSADGSSSPSSENSQLRREGGKLLLRGDPAAPLSSFRFNPGATTPLPSTVNVEKVLSAVQVSVDLPAESQAPWATFFGSPENRKLIEDLFWYRYLTEHQQGLDEEATTFMAKKLFFRMSASFVHLFRRTPKRHLDHILKVYPSALSQTVYLAFFVSCPHECVGLDGKWKTNLERDVSGWCTGMRTRASTYRSWAVNHFDVTPVERYPAHVLTRVEKQLQREGVASSQHVQASRSKAKRHHRTASSATPGHSTLNSSHGHRRTQSSSHGHVPKTPSTLQLGKTERKQRPSLPLNRPIRYREEVVLTNSGFIKHYQEFGKNPRGIPPYSYQHVANFTRKREPRRLVAGLDAMWRMSSEDADDMADAEEAASAASGVGDSGPTGGSARSTSGANSSASGDDAGAGDGAAAPRTYRSLIEAHANEAWDLIKSYKDSKDQMQLELAKEARELAQKEAMRAMEEHAIYKGGVHEYSNYLVKQNKSWRSSSVERSGSR